MTGFVLAIVLTITAVFVAGRWVRAAATSRSRMILRLMVSAALLFPLLQLTAMATMFGAVEGLLTGGTIYRQHAPTESVLRLGATATCDIFCYGLLVEDQYRQVEVEITGAEIDDSGGHLVPYFVGPGLYALSVINASDPACAQYNAWVAGLGIATDNRFEFSSDLVPVRWLAEKGLCLIAERHDHIQSEVAISLHVFFRETPIGRLREFRHSLIDIGSGIDSDQALLAEDRSFHLEPGPWIGKLAALDRGVWGSPGLPFDITQAAPPR